MAVYLGGYKNINKSQEYRLKNTKFYSTNIQKYIRI